MEPRHNVQQHTFATTFLLIGCSALLLFLTAFIARSAGANANIVLLSSGHSR